MTDADKPDEVENLMSMLGVPPGELEGAPAGARETAGSRPKFESLTPSAEDGAGARLDLIGDVDMHVRVELGRKRMLVQDILKLAAGSVVPLESGTADPLDIYVNNRLVARGEVLVVDDNFAIRVTEVVPDGGGKA